MAYKKRTCYLCGKQYEYCPDCAEFAGLPYFMQTFCSESCKTIFDTCTRYNMNILTKEEAASILSKCNMSAINNFKECVQKDIQEIMQPRKRSIVKDHKEIDE